MILLCSTLTVFLQSQGAQPSDSPSCFVAYEETYSCVHSALAPDSTISMRWPVQPARGYVEVRAAVGGNSDCHGESRHRWGVRWVSPGDSLTYEVALGWGNTDFGDLTDRRYLRARLYAGGSEVASHDYFTGINLYDGDNTLALDFDQGGLSISVGASKLADSFTADMPMGIPESVQVWTSTPLDVKSTDVRSWPDYSVLYPSRWTYEELRRHITESTDPMEAFWEYFDRVTDQSTTLGGRYVLATVADGSGGYDIVVVDGASVNPSIWPTGTLKGNITPTIFIDTYTLQWRDASGRWIPRMHDLSATVDNSSLLTLRFPHVDATIRFSRIPLGKMR